MEIALKQGFTLDLAERIRALSNMCRIKKKKKMLSDSFEAMPENRGLHYIGELNKNDVML